MPKVGTVLCAGNHTCDRCKTWENVPLVQCAGKHATGGKHVTDFKRGKKKKRLQLRAGKIVTRAKCGKTCHRYNVRENMPLVASM